MPGGKDMRQSGLRAVPSLRYLQATPAFTEHFRDSDDEGDASVDNGPTGGLTWDGRVDRGRDQARLPLLSPLEMANDSPAAVVEAVRRSPHADCCAGPSVQASSPIPTAPSTASCRRSKPTSSATPSSIPTAASTTRISTARPS